MRDTLSVGIDIGSSGIRCAVASRGGEEKLSILGLADVPSEGVFKGQITSIEDTVASLAHVMEKVERITGVSLQHAVIALGGPSVMVQASRGVVAVSRVDKEIHQDDVARVIEAAQAVATPANYEILHILPRSYTIDTTSGIQDPVGMSGIRLEVDALILQALSSQISTFTRVVERTGLKVDDVVLGPLACAEGLLTRRQKELGVALLNIGASTLSLMVFQEGDLVHARVFPVGAGHVTSDIAIGLRISLDAAEQIKLQYGVASADQVPRKEEISLQDISSEEGTFSRKYVAEIIEARLEELCSLVEADLKKLGLAGLLPFGIILTGGGAKMHGLVEVVKRELHLPASLGLPNAMTSAIDRINDPVFSTALGLLVWARALQHQGARHASHSKGMQGMGDSVKRFMKSFMP